MERIPCLTMSSPLKPPTDQSRCPEDQEPNARQRWLANLVQTILDAQTVKGHHPSIAKRSLDT